MPVPIVYRRIAIALATLCASGALGYGIFRYWLRVPPTPLPDLPHSVVVTPAETRIFVPGRVLVGTLAEFDDGLFAYLMFDYIRSRPQLSGTRVMLISAELPDRNVFRILVRLPDDLIQGVGFLAKLKLARLTADYILDWRTLPELESFRKQTALFIDEYNVPFTKRLKTLHAEELQAYLRRFIRFKSATDPRRGNTSYTVPSPLDRDSATSLAADIIAVARFYDIPIDLFLGIGAMENNYMDVMGDLTNTAWKQRAEPGDIVLRRRNGKVLVRNHSIGVWQITRQSLRYAHRLYLADKRDYSDLPTRLHPPKVLDVNNVENEVLTTYAGLLLRDLLDHFKGDVTLAAGAYNGGIARPNQRYAEGVRMVADYARRIIGRAAELNAVTPATHAVNQEKIAEALDAARESAPSGSDKIPVQ